MNRFILYIIIFSLFLLQTNTFGLELFPNDIPRTTTANNLITNNLTITQEVPEPTQLTPKSLQPKKTEPKKKAEITEIKPEKPAKEPAQEKTVRKLSLNLGSLLLRGDIQLGYEVPIETEWSGMIEIYLNPDPSLNEIKRKYALLGGGKYYLAKSMENIFIELLVGLEWLENNELALGIQIGTGYMLKWQKNVSFDLGIYANRIYHKSTKDMNYYLLAAISIDIGN